MTNHEQIVQAFNNYLTEAETFDEKGVKAAATRARSNPLPASSLSPSTGATERAVEISAIAGVIASERTAAAAKNFFTIFNSLKSDSFHK